MNLRGLGEDGYQDEHALRLHTSGTSYSNRYRNINDLHEGLEVVNLAVYGAVPRYTGW